MCQACALYVQIMFKLYLRSVRDQTGLSIWWCGVDSRVQSMGHLPACTQAGAKSITKIRVGPQVRYCTDAV